MAMKNGCITNLYFNKRKFIYEDIASTACTKIEEENRKKKIKTVIRTVMDV